MNTNTPILLLPIKIETRFIELVDSSKELWVRVFPDRVFLDSFEPRLTVKEVKAIKKYINNPDENTWGELVAAYGVYRATYLISTDAENQKILTKAEEANLTLDYVYPKKVLPDSFVFYLYDKDGAIINPEGYKGLEITENLELFQEKGATSWIENFYEAISKGVGMKIPIEEEEFSKLIVVGHNQSSSSEDVQELFKKHQYTDGFSILEYGTPTNNTDVDKSGYSVKDRYEAKKSYQYVVKKQEFSEISELGKPHAHGNLLSRGLGLMPSFFETVRNSHIKDDISYWIQKATWFVLGNYTIEQITPNNFTPDKKIELWEHFYKYVRAKSIFPTLKMANQPYGLLPVMQLKHLGSLNPLLVKWKSAIKNIDLLWLEEKTLTESNESLLKVLTQLPFSIDHFIGGFEKKKHDLIEDGKGDQDRIDTPIYRHRVLLPYSLGQLPRILAEDIYYTHLSSYENPYNNTYITTRTNFLNNYADGDGYFSEILDYGFKEKQSIEKLKYDIYNSTKGNLTNELLQRVEKYIDYMFLEDIRFEKQIIWKHDLNFFPDRKFVIGRNIPDNDRDFYIKEIFSDELVEKGEIIFLLEGVSKENISKIEIIAPFSGRLTLKKEKNDLIEPFDVLCTIEYLNEEKKNAFRKETYDALKEMKALVARSRGKEKEIRQALTEAIDLSSYRLDAWITSLATKKLDKIRNDNKETQLGAYGWVENLKKDSQAIKQKSDSDKKEDSLFYKNGSDGGIIHTPSAAQTTTAAIFKNAFLTHRDNTEREGNPFTLNLTSERIQNAQKILQGLREGQELALLLGNYFERLMHDLRLDSVVYKIKTDPKKIFLLVNDLDSTTESYSTLHSIDGMKLIKKDNNTRADRKVSMDLMNLLENIDDETWRKVVEGVLKTRDLLDASLDVLFFEAGYNLVEGNLSQASAAMDATRGKVAPPPLESLKSPILGVGVKHQLLIVFGNENLIKDKRNPKAFLEPRIEGWLIEHIGALDKFACNIVFKNIEDLTTTKVIENFKLDTLNLAHLDLLYLSETPILNAASELELRICNELKKTHLDDIDWQNWKYSIEPSSDNQLIPLKQVLEVFRYAHNLLQSNRSIRPEELNKEGAQVTLPSLDDLVDKLEQLKEELDTLKNKTNLDEEDILYLVKFKMTNPRGWLSTNNEDRKVMFVNKIKEELEEKVLLISGGLERYKSDALDYSQQFEILHNITKLLFGDGFILLRPCKTTQEIINLTKEVNQKKLVGVSKANENWGQERLQLWLQGVAQINKGAESLEDWLMIQKAWSTNTDKWTFNAIQLPTLANHPWLGLSKKEMLALAEINGDIALKNKLQEKATLGNNPFYPKGCTSKVVYAPKTFSNIDVNTNVYGLVLEEFPEHIPNETVTTGVGFHYNAPNAEAPQSLLLAVPEKEKWSDNINNDLLEIVNDTIDLVKIRMVDLESLDKTGFALPMTYLPVDQDYDSEKKL